MNLADTEILDYPKGWTRLFTVVFEVSNYLHLGSQIALTLDASPYGIGGVRQIDGEITNVLFLGPMALVVVNQCLPRLIPVLFHAKRAYF